VRKDHRPYWLKKLFERLEDRWTRTFVAPQLDALGEGFRFMKPWNLRIQGPGIRVGRHVHVVTSRDRCVALSSWVHADGAGRIDVGDHALLCPGVRIDSATSVQVGDGCMLAAGVYVTDADWHGLYDRTQVIGATAPVVLGTDTWIGDGAIVCKGVHVGDRSVVGAGAVVTRDVPADTVVAGNPARPVKTLDPAQPVRGRAAMFADPDTARRWYDDLDRYLLHGNSLAGWLRTRLAPRRGD
jgi:acetyltransferase-like isoleucine patch superfamily enzyme